MKSGKRLKHQIEESLPTWRDKFLTYKDLKKLVRLISSSTSSKADSEFVYLLDREIDKFNAFFMEQEEDFIIHQKELQDMISKVMAKLGPAGTSPSESDSTSFLHRYLRVPRKYLSMIFVDKIEVSSIPLQQFRVYFNNPGLAKILKKYEKRTGRVLRLPFIRKVLEQPFFKTDLISRLVKECEVTMKTVFPAFEEPKDNDKPGELVMAERSVFRNTVAAIVTMREMRKASSTYGPLSLPPLNLPENDLIHSIQLLSPVSIV